jgi:hypothetical protein
VAYYAGLSEHIADSLVGRASGVVEVGVVADGLLEEPGDVLDVCGSDAAVGLHLCPRCILSQRV